LQPFWREKIHRNRSRDAAGESYVFGSIRLRAIAAPAPQESLMRFGRLRRASSSNLAGG
jgi:hypothetical protein